MYMKLSIQIRSALIKHYKRTTNLLMIGSFKLKKFNQLKMRFYKGLKKIYHIKATNLEKAL